MKLTEIDKDELTQSIEQVLSELTDFLGMEMEYDYEIMSYEKQDGEERELVRIQLKGGDDRDSLLIGFHGKTLDKLQHLISLGLSSKYKQLIRVLLDVNDYRTNRVSDLENLARRAAQQVVDSGQDMELEPMNAADRRVVHNALGSEKGVKTESAGEGQDRHVVIKAE
jgi:spoIIIJ-associated protein